MRDFVKRFDVRTSAVYAIIAAAWIIVADPLADIIFKDNPDLAVAVLAFKGLGFVVITTLVLYLVLSNQLRKRAHVEQQLELEREVSPTAIVMVSGEGVITYANRQAEKILGIPRGQIVGQSYKSSFWNLTDFNGNPMPIDYPSSTPVVASREPILGVQAAVELVPGKRILLEVNITPIVDEAGTIANVVMTFNDVTVSKEQQNRLRQSEEEFRLLFNNNPYPVWLFDLKTLMFIEVNDAAIEKYGYSRDEFLRMKVTDLQPDEDVAKFLLNFGDDYPPLERSAMWRHILKNKQMISVEITSHQLRYGDRDVMLTVANDITQRKSAERALVASEARYRMLIDQASDAIFIMDDQDRYVEVNSAACKLLGYTRDEILQMRIPNLVRMTLNDPIRYQELQQGKTLRREREMIRKDGSLVPVEFSSKLLLDGTVQTIARDITERKQAEKTLQQSESRYRTLVEQAADGIFIADSNGRYVDVNTAGCLLTGYSRDEILQMTMADMIQVSPQAPLRLKELREKKLLVSERQLICKDGTIKDIEISGKELSNGLYQGIVRDITERKLAEQDLRLKSAALEAVANGVMITDRQGIIQWVNPAFSTLTGYSLEDAQGTRPGELLKSHERNHHLHDVMWQTILRGDVWRGEVINQRKDGSLYDEEQIVTPVYNELGEVTHFVGIKQDITERKHHEEAVDALNTELEARVIERTRQLDQIRNRVASILNSNADSIVYCGLDSGIEQGNPAFTRAFGYQADEMIALPLSKLVIPADVARFQQALNSVLTNRQAQEMDVSALTKEGSTFDASMTLSPVIEDDDEMTGVVLSIHDVTSRNHLLRQAMSLGELKSRYVSMAAHDLRNPMAIILTSADTIQQYSDRLTEEKKQQKFEQIRSSIKNMTDILDDVLIMGQVDSGKLVFNPTSIDLISFCEGLVAESLQAAGTTSRIDFSSEGIPSRVKMDTKLLRHILGNLLSNAIKYSPVESVVLFDLRCNGEQAVFTVQDQGIGIPKAEQGQLFETFYRASNAKQIYGTGLGLAIVKQSVELHGGSIDFESQEGVGTTFVIRLPLVTPF